MCLFVLFLSFTPSGIYLGAMNLRIQVFQHFWKILSHSFLEYCIFFSPLFSFNQQVSIFISYFYFFALALYFIFRKTVKYFGSHILKYVCFVVSPVHQVSLSCIFTYTLTDSFLNLPDLFVTYPFATFFQFLNKRNIPSLHSIYTSSIGQIIQPVVFISSHF